MDINNLCPHCMREVTGQRGTYCPACGKSLDTVSEVKYQLKPFTILQGKYLVGDVLGEGGFGITYIGYDLNLEIRVAIKEFYPNGYATREANITNELTAYAGQSMEVVYKWRDNFLKEARSLAKCAHLSGVVGVKDFFQENNTAYIVQEYLEGITLKEYAKSQGGKVSVNWLFPTIKPVLTALGEVHKTGLIHRDISPDNIMLLKDGQMKLLDFGAARDYTQNDEKSLSVLLKPGYAPEEQYRTKGHQGPWSDIYALAGTIYKCITGVTPPEAMERMRQDTLRRPSELGIDIAPWVEQALMKAMSVFAEQRYQTIEEFQRDLYERNIEISQTIGIPPKSQQSLTVQNNEVGENSKQKMVGFVRTNRNMLGIGVALVAGVIILIAIAGIGASIRNDSEQSHEYMAEESDDRVEEPIREENDAVEKSELIQQEESVDIRTVLDAYQEYISKYDGGVSLLYIDDDSIPECYVLTDWVDAYPHRFELLRYQDERVVSILSGNTEYGDFLPPHMRLGYLEKKNQIVMETYDNISDASYDGFYQNIYTITYYELTDDGIGYRELETLSRECEGIYGANGEETWYFYNGNVFSDENVQSIEQTVYLNCISSYGIFSDMPKTESTVEEAYQALLARESISTEDTSINRYELIIGDVTWTQAYYDCINRGGHLVHINSVEEYNAITNQIIQENKTDYTFWLGAKQIENQVSSGGGGLIDEYCWLNADGTNGENCIDNPSYQAFWLPGEPSFYSLDADGQYMDENCVNMFYRKSEGRFYWNDAPDDIIAASSYYSGRLGYICEYED